MRLGRFGTVVLGAALAAASLAGAGEATGRVAYAVEVRIDPPAGTIDGKVEIRSPGASAFSLARDLKVRRVAADGKPVAFEEAPAAAPATTREVTVKACPRERLAIEYAGPILAESYPRLVSQVNMVRKDLVELAGYVGWLPRLRTAAPFTFRLTVDVPAGFVTVTNGRPAGPERSQDGRTVTEWESYEPTGDVVVLAAPGLRETASESGGVRVELFAARLPPGYLDAMKDDVARAAGLLARQAGAPSPTGIVRVAWSPRPGWGYVRRPLILVSEEAALAAAAQKFGRARDLRYIAHEIAHYWWHWADTGTPDDWVNEGLAEYAALLAARELSGREFADELLEEYRQRSADGATTSAIAETPGDSPDREVNRYARPVLVLSQAERDYGSARVTAFLQALYRRFSTAGRATTADFLDEAERSLGREARDAFSEALYRKSWADAAARPRYVYSPRDAVFLGTWAGSLTQSGTTTRVVLHLVLKDATLVAALDSPDQGARDIPVPSVSLSGDELRFGLGAFGISYGGVLDRDTMTIQGEWKQGGTASPLRLSKEGAPAPGGGKP
jgi:hypothetical protein